MRTRHFAGRFLVAQCYRIGIDTNQYSISSKFIACAFFIVTTVFFNPLTPAGAYTSGYFHLRGTAPDPFGGHALRAMDVLDNQGKVSGFIEATATTFARDSQLWKVRFPAHGTIDHIKLENKLTGQCIGEDDKTSIAVLRPCNDESVIWQVISLPNNKMVIQKVAHLAQPFGDVTVCLTKPNIQNNVEQVQTLTCNSGPMPTQIWEAYVSG